MTEVRARFAGRGESLSATAGGTFSSVSTSASAFLFVGLVDTTVALGVSSFLADFVALAGVFFLRRAAFTDRFAPGVGELEGGTSNDVGETGCDMLQ